MTFSAYLQNLGSLLALALPFAALMYLAVRLGVQHGSEYSRQALTRIFDKRLADAERQLTAEQRARLPLDRIG